MRRWLCAAMLCWRWSFARVLQSFSWSYGRSLAAQCGLGRFLCSLRLGMKHSRVRGTYSSDTLLAVCCVPARVPPCVYGKRAARRLIV